MEAIFGLVGVVLGFALNEVAIRWRERRTEKEQARAVRTLLSAEIDQNIAAVRDWWGQITRIDSSGEDSDVRCRRLALRLINVPLPTWSHRMWESQTPLLPVALNHVEIKQVYEVYSALDAMGAIRSALLVAEKEQREDYLKWGRAPGNGVESSHLLEVLPNPFYRIAPELWAQCEQIVNELLVKGNPLERTPTSSAAG